MPDLPTHSCGCRVIQITPDDSCPNHPDCGCQDVMPGVRDYSGHSDEYLIDVVCSRCGRVWRADTGHTRLVGRAELWVES